MRPDDEEIFGCLFKAGDKCTNCKDEDSLCLLGLICRFHLREIFGLEYYYQEIYPSPGMMEGWGYFFIVGMNNTIQSEDIIFPFTDMLDLILDDSKGKTEEELVNRINGSIKNYIRKLLHRQHQEFDMLAVYQIEMLRNMFKNTIQEIDILPMYQHFVGLKQLLARHLSAAHFRIRHSAEYITFVNNMEVFSIYNKKLLIKTDLDLVSPLLILIMSYFYPSIIYYAEDKFPQVANSNSTYINDTGIVLQHKAQHTTPLVMMLVVKNSSKFYLTKRMERQIQMITQNYKIPKYITNPKHLIQQSNVPQISQFSLQTKYAKFC